MSEHNCCNVLDTLSQVSLQKRSLITLPNVAQADTSFSLRGNSLNSIRVHAIITADSDGKRDAAVNHPDVAHDTHGYKYRIERDDIKKLVDGANEIFSAAGIKLLFDPIKDVEFRHDTLLNRDSLTPENTSVNTQHVFYRSNDGSIYELWSGETWQQKNLTAEASAPAAAGSPAAYTTGASTVKHVIYRGVDGHIHELFAGDTWKHNILTIQANAPQAVGNPFGYTTFDPATEQMDVQHIVYRGTDGHIHELFAGDTWKHNILTIQANAPQAAGDPFGYVTFNPATGRLDIQHVVYRGVDGHIYELFAGNTWQYNILTIQANAPQAAGDPRAYTTNYTDIQHVVYRGVDGHIYELFAGNAWQHNNLTSMTGAPTAVGDPVGYTTNDYNFGVIDDQHVVYRGTDGHIHELFTVDTWNHNILTIQANAPKAASDPTAYTDGSKQTQHIIYRDTAGHIHELFTTSVWNDNNLTLNANSSIASQNPLGYFVSGDNSCGITRNRTARTHPGQLVVYFRYGGQGWSSSTDDFVIMPSIWDPKDLTFLAHEIGHYLHLPHTFGGPPAVELAIAGIQAYVEDLARKQNNGTLPQSISAQILNRGAEAIDGDYPTIGDTPPEPFGGQEADLSVSFVTKQVQVYRVRPDRQNVMNYIPKQGKPAHFSAQQIARMRDALEHRNRQHLISR